MLRKPRDWLSLEKDFAFEVVHALQADSLRRGSKLPRTTARLAGREIAFPSQQMINRVATGSKLGSSGGGSALYQMGDETGPTQWAG